MILFRGKKGGVGVKARRQTLPQSEVSRREGRSGRVGNCLHKIRDIA